MNIMGGWNSAPYISKAITLHVHSVLHCRNWKVKWLTVSAVAELIGKQRVTQSVLRCCHRNASLIRKAYLTALTSDLRADAWTLLQSLVSPYSLQYC